MSQKTGIVKIAEELGVSPSTVSRALRESPRISVATRERVFAAARRHNYLPPVGRERTVALLLSILFTGNYQGRLLREIQKQAIRRRVRLELYLPDALGALELRHYLGILAVDFPRQQLAELAESVRSPILTVNQPGMSEQGIYGIASDDYLIFRECFDLLEGAGHRRIGFLAAFHSDSTDNYNLLSRIDAYRQECRKRGLEILEELMPLRIGEINERFRHLLGRGITALIALIPQAAGPVELFMAKLPVKVPEDLSVIVWESPIQTEWSDIQQRYGRLAETAFDAMEALAARETVPATQWIPYLLTPGSSMAPGG